ncbi:MAG: aminoglycoside phosphotransferase [Acidimicrobiia bacterium]|nr:aminoglycoside phosphotransferase [Acidimicrobiia bacterium]
MSGRSVDPRVAQFVAARGLTGVRVVPLAGDASDRRYFRLEHPGRPSEILALHAGAIDAASLPFTIVHGLFAAMGVPVPRVLGHDAALGILVLEDLGDTTLQARLSTTPADRPALYRQATTLIATIQARGAEFGSPDLLPYRLAFDVEKLTWELRFFTEHFLEHLRGVSLDEGARRALGEEYEALAGELASEPRVLCHRDYHSRNLMVRNGRLLVIDFQDARMGPDTYDLASLLRDSYVDLTDAERDGLIATFLEARGTPTPPDAFRRRFDLMSVQRNLKALGTFGFQVTSRGNASFGEYIPRTLAYIRTNLAAWPRFGRLHELLAAHVPELR